MSYDPDQYTEQQSGLEPQALEDLIADWIDPAVIAKCILDQMAEENMPLTEYFAKRVWLDVLENLHNQLEVSVDRIIARVKC